MAEIDSGVIRNARHNAAIAWIRLPISAIVSGFLFIFIDTGIGWAWLAAILAIEVFAWHVRSRLLAGDVRFQLPHLIALSLVSIAWVVLVLLLWQSSAEVARIASVMTLFSLAFYGVAGGYKSASILLVVGTPPVLALFGILTSLAWTTQEFGPALLTTFATLGTCVTIAFTGWTLHRSDKRLETANGDLRSLTSRLTVLAERERIASNAKENFLANVSHEIRTPLNGIVGLAASLETAALSARDLQSVDVIRQSGEMLERLISDVLDAAAINAGKLQLKPRPFDPAELARSTILLMEGEAASKGLSLSLALSPDTPPRLLGDDLRIRQIILNLLSNAIKYTETGAVTLEVGVDTLVENTDSAVLRLSVIDTGRGFDLASQNRLFERFERGERSGSDANAGLGLGLAITHALVVAMGGDIRASSVVGTGSKFEVTLPLPRALPPVERSVADDAGAIGKLPSADDKPPLRILLVEDHPINRHVVTTILEPTGAEIEICVNGQEAVEAAARTRFDAILMDLLMPVMDGLEATQAIRRHEAETGQTPAAIIMLTASALPSQAELATQMGCDAHLTKPVTPARLFETLARVLRTDDPTL